MVTRGIVSPRCNSTIMIFIYSKAVKLVKDIWEKSMENNGDEIAFFFGCFYFRKRKSADIYEKYPFLVFFGATDGNFTEKYSVTPS